MRAPQECLRNFSKRRWPDGRRRMDPTRNPRGPTDPGIAGNTLAASDYSLVKEQHENGSHHSHVGRRKDFSTLQTACFPRTGEREYIGRMDRVKACGNACHPPDPAPPASALTITTESQLARLIEGGRPAPLAMNSSPAMGWTVNSRHKADSVSGSHRPVAPPPTDSNTEGYTPSTIESSLRFGTDCPS